MLKFLVIIILYFGRYSYKGNYNYVNESILMDNYISMNVFDEEDFTDYASVYTNDIYVGNMSGYGPDCYGCSGYLAYGAYVGNGNIYYDDLEYGKVRIVAGDKSLPFGTIVLIDNSFLAIVLDRGGAIGFDKRFMFDLLYQNEEIANNNGILVNVNFEILRYGF